MESKSVDKLIQELKALQLREAEVLTLIEQANKRRDQVAGHHGVYTEHGTTTNHGYEQGDRIRITNQVTKQVHWGVTSIADGPSHISVEGAGNDAVNGHYIQDGFFEHALRYSRDGIWKNKRHKIYIISCNVSNYTKHWYITIVPPGSNPGTSSDIDFYTAPVTQESLTVPPKRGWTKAAEGIDPPPRLIHRDQTESNAEDNERVGNGTIVEDDVDDDPQSGSQNQSTYL
jgi:hypothetical protein